MVQVSRLHGFASALLVCVGCSSDGTSSTGDGGAEGGTSGGGSTTTGSAGGSDDSGTPATNAPAPGHYFPDGAWMYQDISQASADPASDEITTWLSDAGGWGLGRMQIDFTIEVLEANSTTPYRSFEPTDDFYEPDCDPADFPLPASGALEGEQGYACENDGDCHLLVKDTSKMRLYEMWRANVDGDTFYGGCAAIWDMTRVYGPEGRGDQCSSADAAGFPIAPLLFSADEVAAGEIDHAIRFILPNDRMRADVFTRPGTHAGGPSAEAPAPVYGSRWRLRADFDLGSLPSEGARVVARAMQKYGMALADGGNVALTAQSDRFTEHKWSGLLDARDLDSIQPDDFEILGNGELVPLTYDCTRTPITD